MGQKLPDAELAIMRIIWKNAPEPTLFAQISEELERAGRPCHKNTLITLLRRLTQKGYIQATKIGNKNLYKPVISGSEFREEQTRGFLNKYYDGDAGGLVSTLIKADMLSEEEYKSLQRILEEGPR